MKKIFALLGLLAFVSPLGCTKNSSTPSAAGESKVVNLAIWSNYVSPELLAEFKKKTGFSVQVSNYSSNEELLAKLQAGASGYDVAVPSDYMVSAMVHLQLLETLDHAQLPNFNQLDPKFLKRSFDRENRVSVPYDWGATGIAVNREKLKGEIKSWKELFSRADLRGKFTLLDDSREVIAAALKSKGLSLNSSDPKDLAEAQAVLIGARSRVKGFTSEPMVPLASGETVVAQAYMNDALLAARNSGGKIQFIFPEEGCTFYIDNLVIPKGVKNVKGAHALIDFLLDANSSVTTVKSTLVAPTNARVRALLPPELKDHPVLFPPQSTIAKFEMMEDLGDGMARWDRIWTELKVEN